MGAASNPMFDDAGRIGHAATRYKRALSLQPNYAEGYNNLAVALAAKGRLADAIVHYECALVLNPSHAGIHYNLAIALATQGRIAEAVARYQRALALKPDYADAHNNLGNLLESPAHYLKAIAIDPNHAEAHNNLGNMLRERGNFDEAMVHYERAIAIAPANAEAHLHRAEIKTFHSGEADLAALEALAGRDDVQASKPPSIHFALAKALEDCGDYGRAFEHLRKGNDWKRSQIHYDEPAVAGTFRRIAGERFQGESDPSSVPIFVLGMRVPAALWSSRYWPAIRKFTAPGNGRLCGIRPGAILPACRLWRTGKSGSSTSCRKTSSESA